MKRVMLVLGALLLGVLALVPGCEYILPQSNQPPKAYINAITPTEVNQGQEVRLSGHGTDVDGQVVAYRWRSERDGQIGASAEFVTTSLSVGDHAIYFMVQDNNDTWSAEVRGNVKVLPAVTTPAKVNSFTASLLTIPAGDSVTLAWNVSNATTVSIDQGIGTVSPVASVTVTPAATTTYKLTATGGGSTATAQLTVTVQAPVLDIVFFNADPEEVVSGGVSKLTWKTTGATEVKILPIFGVVAKEGFLNVTLTGEQVHTFTLTATDGDKTLTAKVDIETYLLMPTNYSITIEPVLSESGYVRSTGAPWANHIYVGDDTNNIGIQGFVSFDISGIPDDAVITSVFVDLSDRQSTYGQPFNDLGCLRAYAHNYGTLDGGDYFTGSPLGALGRWCSQDQVDTPGGGLTTGFNDALQDRVGQDRFQIRLQFNDKATDNDGNNDLVRWSTSALPKLIVEYNSYE
jgi:plastocyanin